MSAYSFKTFCEIFIWFVLFEQLRSCNNKMFFKYFSLMVKNLPS